MALTVSVSTTHTITTTWSLKFKKLGRLAEQFAPLRLLPETPGLMLAVTPWALLLFGCRGFKRLLLFVAESGLGV